MQGSQATHTWFSFALCSKLANLRLFSYALGIGSSRVAGAIAMQSIMYDHIFIFIKLTLGMTIVVMKFL